MVGDRHVPDAASFATFVQCLGASHHKNDILSEPFVKEKIKEMKNNQLSLKEISQIEGIFPLKKDLDNFLGTWFVEILIILCIVSSYNVEYICNELSLIILVLDGAKLIDGSVKFVSQFNPINYDEKCSLVNSLNRRSTEQLSSPVI